MLNFIRRFTFVLAISVISSSAWAGGAGFSTKNVLFAVSPLPFRAIESLRDFARKEEINYKFPFSYKNSLLILDTPSGVYEARLCFLDAHRANTLTVQIELVAEKYVFAKSLDDFTTQEYLTNFLRAIFPDVALSIKEVPEDTPDPTCNELRMIQWPKNIF